MAPKRIAFLFPGQGSQSVGMACEVATHHPGASEIIAQADSEMGMAFGKLMFEGPEDALRQTENTQPALYVASAATLRVLDSAGIRPFAVAGHSLGEYTALYAAGTFDFAKGLQLVRTRGKAFADAGAKRPGAMAAILGLDGDKVAALCAELSTPDSIVVPANFNDPAQTVISGDPPAVKAACAKCTEAGAKRAVELPVSGAFHSPLVAPAADVMRVALGSDSFRAPACHFVNNVDAAALTDPAAIKDGLVRQVTGSVRWVECVRKLVELGAEAFVEVGSGKVLSGLVRRIAREIPVHTTESWDAVTHTIAELKSH